MSFMFNPYPYDDPNAFNVLDPSGLPLSELVEGSGASAAAEAAKAAGALKRAEGWVILYYSPAEPIRGRPCRAE